MSRSFLLVTLLPLLTSLVSVGGFRLGVRERSAPTTNCYILSLCCLSSYRDGLVTRSKREREKKERIK